MRAVKELAGRDLSTSRRGAYGTNPVLGPRAQQSRQQILDTALELFATQGYGAVSMDGIAETLGRSRAFVYQYFSSKSEIFLVHATDLGKALLATTRRMGSLGRTEKGFENLRDWVEEWFDVCRRNDKVFLLWASAERDEPLLREGAARWVALFSAQVSARIEAAGPRGIDPHSTALAMAAVMEACALMAKTRAPRLGDKELADAVARTFQLTLFPASAKWLGHDDVPQWRDTKRPSYAAAAKSSRALMAAIRAERRRPATAQGRSTADLVVVSAAEVFARKGFVHTSVDDVMEQAGLSHGTLYLYWRDLAQVIDTVAVASAERLWALADEFAGPDIGSTTPTRVRTWIESLLVDFVITTSIIRLWSHPSDIDARLVQLAEHTMRGLQLAVRALLARSALAGVMHPEASTLVLIALVSHFPFHTLDLSSWATDAEMLEAMTRIICRGFLGVRT